MRKRLARAKVNLYLHVAAPDARGYHPLQSLVMFADAGDEISIDTTEVYSEKLKPYLKIDGPFASGLDTGEDNLVTKAVRAFEAASGLSVDQHELRLTKNLPVASGLGGGSADAGAVLHLLREAFAPGLADEDLAACAARTGADGVMCLWARTAVAEGYGERLTMIDLPSVAAILVNPGVACPTRQVYDGFDTRGTYAPIEAAGDFADIVNVEGLIAALRQTRNDLQAPAIALQPVIAEVLAALEAQPETLFARMSGSGATCFALCASDAEAQALCGRIERMWPRAWAVACRLG
ncbi:MAG: 4-(cytidine 5'-diphospho)-2-C-methyl-D-erythritol kinase [Asticcacaulis sp.]